MALKILIVDDVKLSVEIGKSYLKDKGCDVLSAANGREALSLIRLDKPDLVLTDLHMPEMNGDELCREIKSDPALKHIPVVILSSDSNSTNLEKCHDAGCDGILKKPFKQSDIIESVRQYINIISRKHVRVSVNLDVFFNFQGEQHSSRVIDISRGGMFIKEEKTLPLGTSADFSVLIDGSDEPFTINGEVVRIVPSGASNPHDGYAGMGIRFTSPSPQLLAAIDGLGGD